MQKTSGKLLITAFTAIMLISLGCQRNDSARIVNSRRLENSILVYALKSSYQHDISNVFALLPDKPAPIQELPVVFILPVHPGDKAALAGLNEAKRLDVHNRYNIICVTPSFEKMPWYADNSTDKYIRQESYFVNAVVPLITDALEISQSPQKRFLLGYSKSGWGAWALLLRHPDLFGRALSWDAPLMMDRIGDYNTSEIFGTQENFEQYRIPALLTSRRAMLQNGTERLVLLGHGYFDDDLRLHELLTSLSIPHVWDHGPKRAHSWNSGWLEPAIRILVSNKMQTDDEVFAYEKN